MADQKRFTGLYANFEPNGYCEIKRYSDTDKLLKISSYLGGPEITVSIQNMRILYDMLKRSFESDYKET